MRIVIAPDSFKGSARAETAARAIAEGWLAHRPNDTVRLCPMADGGEGTLEAFLAAVPGARRMPVEVEGPVGELVSTAWALLPPTPEAPGGTGVVELAATCGLELLGGALAPWDARTTGLGQAIRAALGHGVSRLLVGIGSSASTDGGIGCLRVLGYEFFDAAGLPVKPGARGVVEVARVERSAAVELPPGGVTVLSDVTNPLTGPRGAAAVFGPQKGLSGEDVAVVDAGLGRLARLLGGDPATPGGGAAGGTGYALLDWGRGSSVACRLSPGAVEVARVIGLEGAVADADLVVTGEGAFDAQSRGGKAPGLVLELVARLEGRAAIVAGRIDAKADLSGVVAACSLTELAGGARAALAEPTHWLREAGRWLARTSEAAAIPG